MKNIINHILTFLPRISWYKFIKMAMVIIVFLIEGSNITLGQVNYYNPQTGLGGYDFDLAGNIVSDNKAQEEVLEDAVPPPPETCPLTAELKVKYNENCWACPIIKELVESFIVAATIALTLSKEAGIFVLKFGAILWIMLWGLRHVSSLAQVEPANIIAELIKFLFKVMLAYAFISGGVWAIGTYFTNPIMGLGAKIAENFWEEEKVKGKVTSYVWADITEEDYKELEQQEQEAQKQYQEQQQSQQGQDGQNGENTEGSEITGEEQGTEGDTQATEEESTEPKKEDYQGRVPNFLIPPVSEGTITSPAGCRKHPVTKVWKVHKGLDIGGNAGATVVASADGIYSRYYSKSFGCVATIHHDDGWITRYAHMPDEICTSGLMGEIPKGSIQVTTRRYRAGETEEIKITLPITIPSNHTRVKKGDKIGIVGDSGTSTGPHLHFEVLKDNKAVEPLHILAGEILFIDSTCNAQTGATPFPFGMSPNNQPVKAASVQKSADSDSFVIIIPPKPKPGSNQQPSSSSGSSGSSTNYENYKPSYSNLNIKYKGTSVILADSIINSIIGATEAIESITSENMILGEAVMCYATLKNGGAITFDTWLKKVKIMTNPLKWVEGAFIWVTGLLLTMAYAFYLVDISFKIGFAVIALPIAAGLWPFEITKDKLGVCISIIAKSAAMFAFLALTTTYTVSITDAVFSYEETFSDEGAEAHQADAKGKGLSRLYESFDKASSGTGTQEDIEYASDKLALFSTTFVLLLFAFLYSFNLVRQTVPDLVNKFFPDKAFGDSSPMHQWSTAVAKGIKDVAMKPVGYARDIAMHQSGRLAQKVTGKATQAVGTVASKGVQYAGKGVQAFGKGIQAAGKGLQAIPVVGNVAGGLVSAAGKVTEVAGKAVETTGKVTEKASKTAGKVAEKATEAAGDVAEKATDATQKATDGKTQEQEKDKKGDKQ